jgi:hypothetical protein
VLFITGLQAGDVAGRLDRKPFKRFSEIDAVALTGLKPGVNEKASGPK